MIVAYVTFNPKTGVVAVVIVVLILSSERAVALKSEILFLINLPPLKTETACYAGSNQISIQS